MHACVCLYIYIICVRVSTCVCMCMCEYLCVCVPKVRWLSSGVSLLKVIDFSAYKVDCMWLYSKTSEQNPIQTVNRESNPKKNLAISPWPPLSAGSQWIRTACRHFTVCHRL